MDWFEEDKRVYKFIIDGVISSESGGDLQKLLDEIYKHKWRDKYRKMFLLGLLQGTLMQFNKEVSVEELKEIFYNI